MPTRWLIDWWIEVHNQFFFESFKRKGLGRNDGQLHNCKANRLQPANRHFKTGVRWEYHKNKDQRWAQHTTWRLRGLRTLYRQCWTAGGTVDKRREQASLVHREQQGKLSGENRNREPANWQIRLLKVKLKGMNSYENRLKDLEQLANQFKNQDLINAIKEFLDKWSSTYNQIS